MANMNLSVVLDLAILIFFAVSMLIGFMKGFTHRFISFIGTILVFIFAYVFSRPVSLLMNFEIGALTGIPSEVLTQFYPILYQIIAFIGLLIILTLIKVLILFIFKSTIERLIKAISLTHFADSILGSALSLVKSVILVFFVLCIMALPIFSGGMEAIQNSQVASHVMNLVPSVYSQLVTINDAYNLVENIDFSSLSLESLQDQSISSIKSMVDQAQDLGLVTSEQVTDLCNEYRNEIENLGEVVVTESEQQQIEELLDTPGVPEDIKDIVRNKLIVE